jgi:hypothetical protein
MRACRAGAMLLRAVFTKWLISLGLMWRYEPNVARSVRYLVGFWRASPAIGSINQTPGLDRELFRPLSAICGHWDIRGTDRDAAGR